MLTEDDIKQIQNLKERGYAKARVAKTLGLSRGTVSKYWGGEGERVSLTDLKSWFEECFVWTTCGRCNVMAWAPKFLPTWACPNCRNHRSWKEPQFREKARVERP